MVLSSTTCKGVYAGNGSTSVWSFGFDIYDPADLEVWITTAASITSKLDPALYTVNATNKTVTYPKTGAALASGNKLTILRATRKIQELDLQYNGSINPVTVEQALDKIYLILQENAELASRCLRYQVDRIPGQAGSPTIESLKITKSTVGLGNVPDIDCTDPANIVQTSALQFVTAAQKLEWNTTTNLGLGETDVKAYRGDRGKIAYDHSLATGNAHSLTKSDLSIGNIDNTSDANKPISSATQTALNLKLNKVLVGSESLQSEHYDGGLFTAQGWKLSANGMIEATDGIFRGTLSTNVFEKNTVTVVNGDLALADCTKVAVDFDSSQTTLTLEDNTVFAVNDLIRVGGKIETMRITAILADNQITVTRGWSTVIDGVDATATQSAIAKSVILRIGKYNTNHKGYMYLLGSANRMDICDASSSTSVLNENLKVQLGLLTKGPYAGQYGLWAENVSLTGSMTITGGSGIANLTDAGGLATKSAVDLNSAEVTNKSLANLDGTANTKLSGIAAGATVNVFTSGVYASIPAGANGDMYYATDTYVLYQKIVGSWVASANRYTNTNQLTDGAGLGTTAAWSGVSGTGKPADNATVGATWGSNIASQPSSLSGINSGEGTKLTGIESGATAGATWGVNVGGSNKPADNATVNNISSGVFASRPAGVNGDFYFATDTYILYQKISGTWVASANNYTNTNQITDGAGLGTTAVWSGVSGSGKPADNSTVGANWGTNLSSIPSNLSSFIGAPTGNGLFLDATHLGFYNSGTWKTYMDNTGNFYLGGTSGKLTWNGTTLAISGNITLENTITMNKVSDAGGLATKSAVDLSSAEVTNKSLANLDGTANTKLSGIAAGATVGATWGTNIASQPSSLSGINSGEGTKLSGIATGADVTLSAINGGLTVTGGGLTLSGAGSIRGGQTAYNTGTGFFLGYEAAAYKFSLGDPAGNKLTWDGSTLTISGNITMSNTLSADKLTDGSTNKAYTSTEQSKLSGVAAGATVGATWGTNIASQPSSLSGINSTEGTKLSGIATGADVTLAAINGGLTVTGGGITLSGAGSIKGGQTDYATGTGFFLGYSGAAYKFSIGGASSWLKWTGSDIDIKCVSGVIAGWTIGATTLTSSTLGLDSANSKITFAVGATSSAYITGGTKNILLDSGDLTGAGVDTSSWVIINAHKYGTVLYPHILDLKHEGTLYHNFRQDGATLSGEIILNGLIRPNLLTITSSAAPSISVTAYNAVSITAQAEAITSMTTNLSGYAYDFAKLLFRIKDNGTARAITWGTKFEAKGSALPTTTTASKVLTVGFIYDSVTSKWGCVASAVEA